MRWRDTKIICYKQLMSDALKILYATIIYILLIERQWRTTDILYTIINTQERDMYDFSVSTWML